MGIAVMYVKLF